MADFDNDWWLSRQYSDADRVRVVFRQAVHSVGDWPDRVFAAWIAFEQQHGTVESLTTAYALVRQQAEILATRLDQVARLLYW